MSHEDENTNDTVGRRVREYTDDTVERNRRVNEEALRRAHAIGESPIRAADAGEGDLTPSTNSEASLNWGAVGTSMPYATPGGNPGRVISRDTPDSFQPGSSGLSGVDAICNFTNIPGRRR